MSNTSIKQPHSAPTSLEELLKSGLKMLVTSLQNARAFTQQAYAAMPKMYGFTPMSACPCEIPERDCPPRCFCEVTWEAVPGEMVSLVVRVTNSAPSPMIFYVFAAPFSGGAASPGTIAISASPLNLYPGQTGTTIATFTVPVGTAQGSYSAEIVVMAQVLPGRYHQRAACVTLNVGCKQTCGQHCGTCCVAMGDVPVRIRAHQWYHHFQCVERCYIPLGRDLSVPEEVAAEVRRAGDDSADEASDDDA